MTESCQDRIAGELERTLDMLDPECSDCQEGYCSDHICGQDLLEVSRKIVYKILMSTGGPADFFMVGVEDNQIVSIVYHFQDWFDGAQVKLSGDEFKQVESWIYSQVYIEEIG